MSIYVLNVATMLGLALAIDYSLFLVSRFREELRRGRDVEQAVERSVARRARRSPSPASRSQSGCRAAVLCFAGYLDRYRRLLVVLASAIFALTFLPAVLGMLGPRVNSLNLGHGVTGRAVRVGMPPRPSAQTSRWERSLTGHGHPIAVLVPTMTVPADRRPPFLHIDQAVPDAAVLPAGIPSRDAYVTIATRFPRGKHALHGAGDIDGRPDVEGISREPFAYADGVAAVPSITGSRALPRPHGPADAGAHYRRTSRPLLAAPGARCRHAPPAACLPGTYISGNTVLPRRDRAPSPSAAAGLDAMIPARCADVSPVTA